MMRTADAARRPAACGRASPAALLTFALAFISGCASNAVRLESASAVSRAANAAVERSRQSVEEVGRRRFEANVYFVASNPSCDASSNLTVYLPATPQKRAFDACAAPTQADVVRVPISFNPPSDEAMLATVNLLAAVADYAGAMAKIIERPNADIAAEIDSVIDKAGAAAGIISKITGQPLDATIDSGAAAVEGKTGVAAIALLQFALNLAEEQRKADDIRALVSAKGEEFENIVTLAGNDLELFAEIFAVGDAEVTASSLAKGYAASRATLDFERRASLARLALSAQAEVDQAKKTVADLSKSWTLVSTAHATLREHLAGNFDEATRAKIANENRKRLVEALNLMAAVAGEIGGL